ncbi:MAG: hypothetical protein OXC94_02830 [Chloroflexi bacterium]|nr:hypothetical protein [Chloroflexota bacterium]
MPGGYLTTREEIEAFARRTGLTRFTPEQMEEFSRAALYMGDLIAGLPRDFAPAEEPAHVFRAREEA